MPNVIEITYPPYHTNNPKLCTLDFWLIKDTLPKRYEDPSNSHLIGHISYARFFYKNPAFQRRHLLKREEAKCKVPGHEALIKAKQKIDEIITLSPDQLCAKYYMAAPK